MRTSEVLHTAADLIERHGWTTGSWANAPGMPLCAEGAIAAAMGVTSTNGRDVIDATSCPATSAVRKHVGQWPSIWNDGLRHEIFRSLGSSEFASDYATRDAEALRLGKQKVIEVLRATALIEASRESELSDADLEAIAERFPEADVINGRLMVDIAGETVTFVAHRPIAAPVLKLVTA